MLAVTMKRMRRAKERRTRITMMRTWKTQIPKMRKTVA